MNKMKRRARLCLLLALVLFLGLGYYIYKLVQDGDKWVAYPGNGDVYTEGYISKGTIYDRNGVFLLENTTSGVPAFNEDYGIRRATVHAVGDSVGNISTAANYLYANRLVGYNFLMGTYSTNNKGRDLYLTIDANLCKAANNALDGRKGVVAVMNYKTGEIVCMVSAPNYDPLDPPKITGNDSSGYYINKFLSATYPPGSTMKVVTSEAALETIDGVEKREYDCPYSQKIGTSENDRIICAAYHGHVDFYSALAKSCNNFYGELAIEMGPDTLKQYVEKAGLMKSYDIDGIPTTPGTFDFPREEILLAWTGIGQYHDMVNPCAMLCYMSAIANGGTLVEPHLVKELTFPNGWKAEFPTKHTEEEIVRPSTAEVLDKMLRNDVTSVYGQGNFPGLELCGKSGTAELGNGKQPHAWFYGYLQDPDYPYAIVVVVENGGYGIYAAGSVANQVLQEIVKGEPYSAD